MDAPKIFVINPGSTSTKLALYEGAAEAWAVNVPHAAAAGGIADELPARLAVVEDALAKKGVDPRGISAIAARGGLMRPVGPGVYRVTEEMVEDLKRSQERWGVEHASSLGAMIALDLSGRYGMPAFVADPVTVDEMDEVARLSGVPEIKRTSLLHALNVRAVVKRAARELGLESETEWDFAVAHMGGGATVAAVRGGRIVDVSGALLGMGPFSPARAGALPLCGLMGLAYSGLTRTALEEKLTHESGLMGYTGTEDLREVERRIKEKDEAATTALAAMAYQTAKEVAAMASAAGGRVRAVILTGGTMKSELFSGMVARRVGFLARVLVYPGEAEMEALAAYALGALTGKERVREYGEAR